MTVSPEWIEELYQQVLGRHLEPDLSKETAARLSGLLERVRQVDESRLRDLSPSATFDLSHAGWHETQPGHDS
ncbi:MAG: hypothetical protein WD535_06550, partial [Thermaerobacterales bacterium]